MLHEPDPMLSSPPGAGEASLLDNDEGRPDRGAPTVRRLCACMYTQMPAFIAASPTMVMP